MELNLSSVRFSKRDLEKRIILPKELSEDLAEDIGIHVGDGGLHWCNSKKTTLMFSYSSNISELEYVNRILDLKRKLYNLRKIKRYTYHNEHRIQFCSLAISTFYSNVLGIPIGSKKDFTIPRLIEESTDTKIISAYLRGVIDTDFCLLLRIKYGKIYPSLVGAFSNKNLVYSLKKLFKKLGIDCYVEENIREYHSRAGKYYLKNRINLNGYKRVHQWINLIGYNNRKYTEKIKKMGPA